MNRYFHLAQILISAQSIALTNPEARVVAYEDPEALSCSACFPRVIFASRLRQIRGAIRHARLLEGQAALAALVAAPAMLPALGRHAGQGQLQRQIAEALDDFALMQIAVWRFHLHLMAQSGAQDAGKVAEEF